MTVRYGKSQTEYELIPKCNVKDCTPYVPIFQDCWCLDCTWNFSTHLPINGVLLLHATVSNIGMHTIN